MPIDKVWEPLIPTFNYLYLIFIMSRGAHLTRGPVGDVPLVVIALAGPFNQLRLKPDRRKLQELNHAIIRLCNVNCHPSRRI